MWNNRLDKFKIVSVWLSISVEKQTNTMLTVFVLFLENMCKTWMEHSKNRIKTENSYDIFLSSYKIL